MKQSHRPTTFENPKKDDLTEIIRLARKTACLSLLSARASRHHQYNSYKLHVQTNVYLLIILYAKYNIDTLQLITSFYFRPKKLCNQPEDYKVAFDKKNVVFPP